MGDDLRSITQFQSKADRVFRRYKVIFHLGTDSVSGYNHDAEVTVDVVSF